MTNDAELLLRTSAAAVAGTLPEAAAERLLAAARHADAVAAVREAGRLLDSDNRLSLWAVAGVLSARLSRFRSTGYQHITAGHRGPRDALEACMTRILDCPTCPRSQGRLLGLLG